MLRVIRLSFPLILFIYAGLALFVTFYIVQVAKLQWLYLALYALVPSLGALTSLKYSRFPYLLMLGFFMFHLIRPVGDLALLPFTPPLSLGIPILEIAKGSVLLLDFFSLIMVVLCIHLSINTKTVRLECPSQ